MKNIILAALFALAAATSTNAQLSRLHVKATFGSTVGITTGSTNNKVIGLNHDGTAGIISATTLDGASDYSPLKFATSGQTRLTIFENGFIGVGVVGTPSAELTVAGRIHAKDIKVTVNAGTGPDYVFLPSYQLKPLKDVSLYINQHRHLPDVPSAVKMETEGVNVSEMNMILLKKVEELTLYLIEQSEKLEELNVRLKAQQEEISILSKK